MSDPAPGVAVPTAPADVRELDLARPVPALERRGHDRAYVVVTLCGRPLGVVDLAVPASPETVVEAIRDRLADQVAAEAPSHGAPVLLNLEGLPHADCPVVAERATLARSGPPISVAVCTRDQPEALERLLASAEQLDYAHWELVVIDNAPRDDRTRKVCEASALQPRYVLEPQPGLSHARNRALSVVRHPLVAFLDDDELVDRHWLSALAAELERPDVVGVTGLVLPAELTSMVQVRFEQFGGHSKGRGFARAVFDPEHQRRVQSPYFPKPTFGAGANMAFRAAALREVGGFDAHLGAGTPTGGSEDTLALSEVMLAGGTVVYTPAALTWHFHRREQAALAKQLGGYGVGLGAFYAALIVRSPRRLPGLLRAIPRVAGAAVRALRDDDSGTVLEAPGPGPMRKLAEMLRGAWIYWRSARRG